MPRAENGDSDAYAGIRVAILGATGFIGRCVARAAAARGAHVALLTRDRSATAVLARDIGADLFACDLTDAESLQRALGSVRPAVTFNLAGYGVRPAERDETTLMRTNAEALGPLCDALAEHRDATWHGQALMHVGSQLEYGDIGGSLDEDAAVRPTTPYGRAKLAGTLRVAERCRASGLAGMTARLFNVYGPGEGAQRLLPSLLRTAAAGEPLELTPGTQARDFTYVEDVAEGLLRLGVTDAAPGSIVNLATGRLTTVRAFVRTAAALLGIAPELLVFGGLPTRQEETPHEPLRLERLRSLTGWSPPTSVEDGIRRTLAWMKRHG